MRIAFVAVALALVACSPSRTGGAPPSASPSESPSSVISTSSPLTIASGAPVPKLRLAPVASLTQPIALVERAGVLYVAQKGGRIRAIRDGKVQPGSVLDLTASVSDGSEQGLLGLAFHPDGESLVVNYTDRAGDTRIVEYPFANGRALAGRARNVLRVQQPFANHNGGHIAFGPDDFLYIFLGDGGSGGDPQNNGQRLNTLLGKVLRIDVRPAGSRPYVVSGSNPFVGRAGARPEIWAYGLRNPWRASFDRETGDLWIADVGQGAIEEIDFQPASSKGGENYGWRALEGKSSFAGRAPKGHVPPVYQYGHRGSVCAVVGGVVYRGSAIPALRGRYLFADHCDARVRALRMKGASYVADELLTVDGSPTAFGEDANGEVYVLTLQGSVARLVRA